MSLSTRRRLVFGAVAAMAVTALPAYAARIVVFGDSWGVPAAPALQQVLLDHGLPDTVANAAVGGETAANLSSATGLQHITNSLAANPEADLVHLSIWGNDFLGQWSSSLTPAQEDTLFAAILDDVEVIVDHILNVRPDALVLWSSYDFPRPLSLGTPAEVNAALLKFSGLAQALADAKGPGLTYGDFNGLMQITFGFDGFQQTSFDPPLPIPPGDPSLPDPTLPSPAASFSDSIHLTSEGYGILAEAQYDSFYAMHLPSQPAAIPALTQAMKSLLTLLLLATGTALVTRVRR